MTATGARAALVLAELGRHQPRRERAAVERLVSLGPAARVAIIEALRAHPNAHARGVAATALGHLGGAESRRALLAALDDPTMVVRLKALLALERSGWDARVARGVVALVDDPSPGVRNNAIAILGRHGERRARAAIRRRLRDERAHVRVQSARALAAFAVPRAPA